MKDFEQSDRSLFMKKTLLKQVVLCSIRVLEKDEKSGDDCWNKSGYSDTLWHSLKKSEDGRICKIPRNDHISSHVINKTDGADCLIVKVLILS
jgi:hypothetical protein